MLTLWLRRTFAFPTLLHFTHVKAGSTWIERMLADLFGRRVQPRLGAELFSRKNSAEASAPAPLSYARLYAARPFIRGAVYPGMFLTRQEFLQREDFQEAKRFVVLRDLRDTLVSQYFSLKDSHALDAEGHVQAAREKLQALDREEGLLWIFERDLAALVELQRSWAESREIVVRYEDLILHGLPEFEALFLDRLDLPISQSALKAAFERARFEKVFGRELGQVDEKSHGRQGLPGDWRHHFTPRLRRIFHERTGDLLVATGYEPDAAWVEESAGTPAR